MIALLKNRLPKWVKGATPWNKSRARVQLQFETQRYLVKLADNRQEKSRAFQLRYDIFFKELMGVPSLVGIDTDRYDLDCDHLIVVDKSSGEVVGTYRLRSSQFCNSFYSETEFEIQHFLSLKGPKLELGRACIRQDHRNGSVIRLMWKLIFEYAQQVKAEWIFGCTSLMTLDRATVDSAWALLQSLDKVEKEFSIEPFKGVDLLTKTEGAPLITSEQELPSLFRAYLKLGAKVCGLPSVDFQMKCVDFFTVIRAGSLLTSFGRRNRRDDSGEP